ncbi:MAG: hypothetical protein LIQ30_03940, partial [Planctomycetes bacterium]|nr:hypothetical protein [Planctomycetota bacterium]
EPARSSRAARTAEATEYADGFGDYADFDSDGGFENDSDFGSSDGFDGMSDFDSAESFEDAATPDPDSGAPWESSGSGNWESIIDDNDGQPGVPFFLPPPPSG